MHETYEDGSQLQSNMKTRHGDTDFHGLHHTKNEFGDMNRCSNTESWDAVQRTNTHSKFAGVKRHECLPRAMTAQILAMKPKREMIHRSHSGTFIPLMSTEE